MRVATNFDLVFEVKDILNGKKETVYCSRMISYNGSLDGSEVDERLIRAVEHNGGTY